jgi:L-iditol 2-dehydrogenase
MDIVAIHAPKQCELVQRPAPKAGGDFVVVKIHVAPMCTEYHGYRDGWKTDCLGHEAAGEVVEVARPGKVKVGDRVVVMPQNPCGKCELCIAGHYIHCEHCQDVLAESANTCGAATYGQYLVKKDWLLLPVPDGISYAHASMACCGLGPTFGALRRTQAKPTDTVLIVGLGPVGLGGVIGAAFHGCRVIGVESQPYRAALARKLGAAAIIDPKSPDALDQVKQLTGGRGVDVAIDCTAVPTAQKFAMDATRRLGQVAFVGWGGKIERENMIPQGLTLHGCWHYPLFQAADLMRMIERTGPQLDQLITHSFPMSQVEEAWKLQLSGNCGKVLLLPWKQDGQ